MAGKDSPQDVINSFQKRQKTTPLIIWSIAVLLVVAGIIILVVWLTGPNRPAISILTTATPTPTETITPTPITPTITITVTSTVTITATITETATPSGPFEYSIEDNDTCYDIAEKFEVDLDVLLAINDFGNECPIVPGQIILIPAPGQVLPTETPLPTGLASGTKVEYIVKSGDTLDIIASKFNTTIESILKENEIDDPNTIFVGQILIIQLNLVTPTITLAPTSTPAASQTP